MDSQFVGSNKNKKSMAVGIDRMSLTALPNNDHIPGKEPIPGMGQLVDHYHSVWQILTKQKLNPAEKIAKVEELLIMLGHFHALSIEKDKNFDLDLFVEMQKFYQWAKNNINGEDKEFLNHALKFKSNPQSEISMQLLNNALQAPLPPSCLFNIIDGLYANQQSHDLVAECNDTERRLPKLEKLIPKNIKKKPKVGEKIDELVSLLKKVDEVGIQNRQRVRAKFAKDWLSSQKKPEQSTSPEIQRNVQQTSPEIQRNVQQTSPEVQRTSQPTSPEVQRTSQPTSPEVERTNQPTSPVIPRRHHHYLDRKSALFNTGSVFDFKEYSDDLVDAGHVREFTLYDKIIRLAFSILNDPDFKSLKDKNSAKELMQLIVDCTKLSTNLIDKVPHIQSCFTKEQNCTQLAAEICNQVTFGDLSYKYLEMTSGNFEENYIVTCLGLMLVEEDKEKGKVYENDRYTLRPLGGGNDRVYLIKSKETNAAVVLRGRFANSNEMEEGKAPDQMRFRVCGALGVDGCASQIYAFVEGAEGTPEATGYCRYRNYEISEALSHGNLGDKFEDLHRTFNEKVEQGTLQESDVRELQVNILDSAIKLIKLIAALKEAGICWADLKPSNILFDENGEFIISDIKTWIDTIGKSIYESEEPLQLTPGYLTVRTSYLHDGKVHYDLDRVLKETVAFTLYQLITGVTQLKTFFLETVTLENRNEEKFKKCFKEQLDQLVSMAFNISPQSKDHHKEKDAHPIYSGPLGKQLKQLTMFILGLVNNEKASLETILDFIDTKELQAAIKEAKKPKSDNNNVPYQKA